MTGARRTTTVAVLLPALSVVLCAPALAGWSSSRATTTAVETAAFAYPGGAAQPPAPSLELAEDRTATLSWPATVLAGDQARPMTGYAVTAVSPESGTAAPVGCALTVAPVVTCTGLDRALAETHGFTVRPVFRWWAGAPSAPSEPLPAQPQAAAAQGPEPTEPAAQDPPTAQPPTEQPLAEQPATEQPATEGPAPAPSESEPTPVSPAG